MSAALRRSWPWLVLYALALLPALLLGTARLGALAWALACFLAWEAAAPDRRTRHLAGALLAFGGTVALVYLSAMELRPAAGLLFVPAVALPLLGRVPRLRAALARFPVATALLYASIVGGLYALGPFPTPNDDFLFALRAAPRPPALPPSAREAAVRLSRAVLTGSPPDAASQELQGEPEGAVFVTLLRPSLRDHLLRGEARQETLAASIVAATEAALASTGRASVWTGDPGLVRVWIDLAGPEERLGPSPLRDALGRIVSTLTRDRPRWSPLVYAAEPGVDGLRLRDEDTGREGVLLPADLLIEGLVSPRSMKRRYRVDDLAAMWKELNHRAGRAPGATGSVPFTRFRTRSFAQPDPSRPRTVELFRANTLLEEDLDEAGLLDAIDRAGRWLLNTVGPDGRFDYEYFPAVDRHGAGYNEVRHAGSVYGLFHMARLAASEPRLAAGSDAYLAAGLRALDRVYRNLGPTPGVDEDQGLVTFLEGKGGAKSNSGSPALTLLAFLERPDGAVGPALATRIARPGDDAIMEGLAGTLVRMIDERGAVYRRWTEALRGGGVQKEPLYYPGEVMLALARYHQRSGDPRWLAAAQRIGRRQIRLAARPFSVPDHWVMQALDILDSIDPEDREWRDGAYAMGRRYLKEQLLGPGPEAGVAARAMGLILPRPPFPDYRGAYRRIQEPPRTTRAAARGEALGGVARIAWRHGDPSAAWERSLLDGARHLREQMLTEDNSFYFPDPEEGLGAIRMGLIDNHLRIDNNQHGVVALSNALDALRRAHRPQEAP